MSMASFQDTAAGGAAVLEVLAEGFEGVPVAGTIVGRLLTASSRRSRGKVVAKQVHPP